jgi:hypothetical protein
MMRRGVAGGAVNVHMHCKRRSTTDPNHPDVRWRQEDLEQAFAEVLETPVIPLLEVAAWFREAIRAALADISEHQRRQRQALGRRQAELRTMQDPLLTAYLEGTVDEAAYQRKSADLKAEAALVEESLRQVADMDPWCGERALATFDSARRWSSDGAVRTSPSGARSSSAFVRTAH